MAVAHGTPADVDVVIVSWNSADRLGATLDSLPDGCRTIVVDNASRDGSVALAHSRGCEVVELDSNVGFPAAANLALHSVTAPFTLLLNPDLVVGAGAVERCLAALRDDPTIGMAGPATRLPDGRPEPPAARRDRRAWHVVVESLGLVHLSRRFDRQMIHRRNADRDVDAINGAFMLVRTEVLRALGGLDASVFLYLEDIDLCRRVRDAGYRIRFVASASATHAGGASTATGTPDEQDRAYLHRIDADLEFLRRYGQRGEAGVAVLAHLLRATLGLVASLAVPSRRTRYRGALRYTWQQRTGRVPAPRV